MPRITQCQRKKACLNPGWHPHTLGRHLVPTHPGGSGLGFSSWDSSLSAPASSSSELESATVMSSFRLDFLLRSLFFRPVEATPMMMGSGSLAVPSWDSEGNPDRLPQGMGDVHRRGGTCSCGVDQGRSEGLLSPSHPEPCRSLKPWSELIWSQQNRHGGWAEATAAWPCNCCWPQSCLAEMKRPDPRGYMHPWQPMAGQGTAWTTLSGQKPGRLLCPHLPQ